MTKCKLTEQHIKEQQDTDVVTEEISDLGTNILESVVGAAQSKDSVALSLVDDSNELILQDLVPEEVTVDTEKMEDKEDFKSNAGVDIHG